ncbi:MAG TPA: hypothetical protein VNA18_02680 [Nitrososphaeraceae archaeon]|nr:hypothetical protein [Nitrososphaeraceae archaeon]
MSIMMTLILRPASKWSKVPEELRRWFNLMVEILFGTEKQMEDINRLAAWLKVR